MISSLLHLVDLGPRVYYTLTNFRGGGKAPLAPPPLNTPMPTPSTPHPTPTPYPFKPSPPRIRPCFLDHDQAMETYRISCLLFFRTCVTLFRLRPELQPSDTIYGHIHRNSIFHTTFKD